MEAELGQINFMNKPERTLPITTACSPWGLVQKGGIAESPTREIIPELHVTLVDQQHMLGISCTKRVYLLSPCTKAKQTNQHSKLPWSQSTGTIRVAVFKSH